MKIQIENLKKLQTQCKWQCKFKIKILFSSVFSSHLNFKKFSHSAGSAGLKITAKYEN